MTEEMRKGELSHPTPIVLSLVETATKSLEATIIWKYL